MERRILAGAALAFIVLGCTTQSSTPTASAPVATTPPATAIATVTVTAPPTPVPTFPRNPAPIVEGQPYLQHIDPAMFVDAIDNPFLPWVVGTKFVFDGTEHVEVTVQPDTKEILGVRTTVVRDQVFLGTEKIEDTFDWYAQDRQGNVWYFGEQTAEYEYGKVTSTEGSWTGGVDGAQPGIVMLAEPQVGDSYRQEYLKGEAEDLAAVTATTGKVSVPAGSWSGSDVLVTEEWTPLEPKVREQKTYARGYGVVEAHLIKGGKEHTKLTSVTTPAAATVVPPSQPDVAVASAAAGAIAMLLLALGAAARRPRAGVRSRPSQDAPPM